MQLYIFETLSSQGFLKKIAPEVNSYSLTVIPPLPFKDAL